MSMHLPASRAVKEQKNREITPCLQWFPLDSTGAVYYSMIMKLSNYVKIFKALSNEQRLKIFLLIYEHSARGPSEAAVIPGGAKACCPIEKAFTMVCNCMDLSRSTISHHFKELQNAGLITCERDGQSYRCRANEDALDLLRGFLK